MENLATCTQIETNAQQIIYYTISKRRKFVQKRHSCKNLIGGKNNSMVVQEVNCSFLLSPQDLSCVRQFKSLMVMGKQLFLNLLVWYFRLLYFLPDGSSAKWAWPRLWGSVRLMIDAVALRQLLMQIMWTEGKAVPEMCWAESITLHPFVFLCIGSTISGHDATGLDTFYSKSVVICQSIQSIHTKSLNLLKQQRCWPAFFMITSMWCAQDRSSELLTSGNLKLLSLYHRLTNDN